MTTPRFLPSSPPAQARSDIYTTLISSSPDLPSLNELVSRYSKKPPPFQSGSNAASIPTTATTTLTTAAKLLQSAQAEEADSVDNLPPPRAKAKAKPKQKEPPEVIDISPDVTRIDEGLVSGDREIAAPTESQSWKVYKSPSPRNSTGLAAASVLEADNTTVNIITTTTPTELGKNTASIQSKVTKSKVRKTSAASRKKKAETVSRQFPAPPDVPTAPETTIVVDDAQEEEELSLELAVARRLDWTPPCDTKQLDSCLASPDAREITSSVGDDTLSVAAPATVQNTIQTLKDKFAYPVEPVTRRINSEDKELAPPLEVIKKRKVIQLVGPSNNGASPNQKSPVKSKAPKKKPRTITDLATAAYASGANDYSNAPAKPEPLVGYLEGQGEQVLQHGHPASRSRKPERRRKPKGRGQVLLSPLSAIDQYARQDFVFGTSSQLAQENSPTFLKDLHAALRQSNDLSDGPFVSPIAAAPQEGRKLWNAGARDEEGDLMNIEVINLIDSAAFPEDPDAIARVRIQKSPSKSEAKSAKERRSSVVNQDPSKFNNLEPCAEDSWQVDRPRPTPPSKSAEPRNFISKPASMPVKITMAPENGKADSPGITPDDDLDYNEPPPSNQEAYQMLPPPKPIQPKGIVPPRPNYEVMTDVELSNQVSKYGFKSVKKRSAMIALLNQCWESKAAVRITTGQSATFATTTLAAVPRGKTSTSAAAAKSPPRKPRGRPKKIGAQEASDVAVAEVTTPVKRPRGRPKKNPVRESSPDRAERSLTTGHSPLIAAVQTPRRRKKAVKPVTVEILDSDDDARLSPSPSSSPEPVFSSPEKDDVDISIGEDTALSLATSPTAQQAELFACITRAVKSAPRSTDPDIPSWHEKMLLYDPIVLEDLASWLNAGQLDRVGYDGEVAPTDVKMWCESKSVCCLWRMSYRGKERKRL